MSSSLKDNDIAILNYIFDPNITGKFDINDPSLDAHIPQDCEEVSSERVREAVELELRGVRLAEAGSLGEALTALSRSLALAERASALNNRAQVYRLTGDEESAMEDLEKALKLSNYRGRVGCQALCQRGMMNRKLGKETEARRDFQAAAELGSSFAKRQLVEMNPYAAMCNQMMRQMLCPKTSSS